MERMEGEVRGDGSGLSARERQVLLLLADGATSVQIGHALGIEGATVDKQINSAREKLGVANRIELASFALRKGLIDMDGVTRLIVWEVSWTETDEMEEIILRYQPQDMTRRYPEWRGRVDKTYSELVPEWREKFAHAIEAHKSSRTQDKPVPFEGEVEFPPPVHMARFDGTAEPLGNSRFLIRLTSPLPD